MVSRCCLWCQTLQGSLPGVGSGRRGALVSVSLPRARLRCWRCVSGVCCVTACTYPCLLLSPALRCAHSLVVVARLRAVILPFLPLPLALSHAEPPTARTATSCLAGGVGSVRAGCPARAPPGLLGDGGDVGGSSSCPQPLCVGQKLCSIGSMVGVVFVVCGQCPSWHAELVPVPAASAVPVCQLRQNRTCTRWGWTWEKQLRGIHSPSSLVSEIFVPCRGH